MNYKKQKNLISTPTEYTKVYGDFRGVDFSSEQTEVHDQRFAYAVNMYRDYRNSEGNVIETIPGFRRVIETKKEDLDSGILNIYSMYKWKNHLFVTVGHNMFAIPDDGKTRNVTKQHSFILTDSYEYIYPEGFRPKQVLFVSIGDATFNNGYNARSNGILFDNKDGQWSRYLGETVVIHYFEDTLTNYTVSFENGSPQKSRIFVEFDNKLLFFDVSIWEITQGDDKKFYAKRIKEYRPTVYLDIGVGDDINIAEFEYEQKNLLDTTYCHTYIEREVEEVTDEGSKVSYITAEYPLYSSDNFTIIVWRGHQLLQKGTDAASDGFWWDKTSNGTSVKLCMPKNAAELNVRGVKIIYRAATNRRDLILHCSKCSIYDGRIFIYGNADYPNTIWFCGHNHDSNKIDPGYWGELDYIQDGYDGKIVDMMSVSDTLAVLKSDAIQGASMYFHTRYETGEDYIPVTYPKTSGLGGLGKIYTCKTFRDDPLFISDQGIEAISQLSVRLERALEHRSYLIDAKLLPLDLSKMKLSEWGGYLVVLAPGGKIFLGDSRQRYTHSTGVMQYEWFYLEDIGIYEDSETEYVYAGDKANGMPETVTVDGTEYPLTIADNVFSYETKETSNLTFSPVIARRGQMSAPTVHKVIVDDSPIYVTIEETWDGQSYTLGGVSPKTVKKALLCQESGGKVGKGTFYPATSIFNIDGYLYFGTDNGVVCKFNFDMKNEDGTTPKSAYNFDGRTIFCGVATKLDNCGIPHLTKSTIKKSMVLKTKSSYSSAAKIKVRTNAKGYESVARISSNLFDENDMDFSDFSFAIENNPILAIKEKEKHWVEKQHWIYSDEFEKPFSIHYLAFRYKVSGRIK